MNERKISLTISVNDKDVKSADVTVQRLEKSIKDTGTSGNSLKNVDKNLNEVEKEAKQTTSTIERLEKSIKQTGSAGSSIGNLKTEVDAVKAAAIGLESAAETAGSGMLAVFNPVTFVVTASTAAVAAWTAGAVLATQYAYELAQSFASYGSEIGKAQQITGLTAETLSSLNAQAEATGLEFNSILDPITQFSTKIGEAAKGSKEAQEDLTRLGIDGKKYVNDLDGALQKAFTTINNLPPGIAKITAANSIFGEEGTRELLPFITTFDGDLRKLTETMSAYGVVLSQDDVQASREFNKAMKEVQLELRGVGLTLGRDLLPIARDVFRDLSGFYKENKAEIREWSIYIADIFRGAFDGVSKLVTFIKDNWGWISGTVRVAAGLTTFGGSEVAIYQAQSSFKQMQEEGQRLREAQTGQNSLVYQSWDSSKVDNANKYFSTKNEADKAKKETNAPSIKQILDAMREGTRAQESGGARNPLSVQNPRTNATGLFQVMPENIDDWTRKWLGRELTIDQFKASPSAQIAVFNGQMGEYLEKSMKLAGGDWQEGIRRASTFWYGTRSNSNDFAQMRRFNPNEPSRGEYSASVLNRTLKVLKINEYGGFDENKINAEIYNAEAKRLAKELLAKQPKGEITSASGDVSIPIMQTSFGDAYLKTLKESLGTQEKINEISGRIEKHYQIVDELLKDAVANQQLTLQYLSEQVEVQEALFSSPAYRKSEQEIMVLQEQLGLKQDIFELENRIATAGVSDDLRIQKAALEDILSLREREVDSVISINRNQLELNQKWGGFFSQNQADALILEHLNQSTKSLTETYAEAKIGIIDGFWSSLDEKISKATDKLGVFGSVIKDVLMNLLKLATSKIFAPQTGGQFPGGFNVGSLLGGLFGNNPSSSYRTPSFTGNSIGNPSGTSTIHELAQNITSTLAKERTASLENTASGTRDRIVSGLPINDITRTASGGKFSFGNLTSGLGALAPLLGLSMGMGVGGTSTTGQILGGAGGLLGGLSAMGFLAPTMFATMLGAGGLGLSAGMMAAIPIVGAIAAPLLLLGGWLIGRSKQRRQEEIQRTQVINDAFGQLDEILKQVNSDKMDGQSGIAQANSIRQQYLQQVSQLKDTKTRNIAIKDASRLVPKIEAIRQAASAQDTRQNIAEKWIPVYASGNYFGSDNQISDMRSLLDMRRGYIAGNMPGVDRHFGMFADDEAIINRTHMNRINALAGYDLLSQVGIPNYPKSPQINNRTSIPKFADGAMFSSLSSNLNSSNKQDSEPTINNFDLYIDAEGLVHVGLKSNRNKKQVIGTVKTFIKTKG